MQYSMRQASFVSKIPTFWSKCESLFKKLDSRRTTELKELLFSNICINFMALHKKILLMRIQVIWYYGCTFMDN